MAHYRAVDRDIWQHPVFRSAPALARQVYLYLITAAADDEGRFLASPAVILEGVCPRSDPTTAEEVNASLRFLARRGLILLYRENRQQYGFLAGWFEHQAEPKSSFQESSLPVPPIEITSWAIARKIKEKYVAAVGGKDLQGHSIANALRWYGQQQNGASTERQAIVDGASSNRQAEGKVVEGKVVEEKGEGSAPPPAAPPSPGRLEGGPGPGYNFVESGPFRIALQEASPPIYADQQEQNKWARALLKAAQETAYPLNQEQLIEAIHTSPPSTVDTPQTWLRGLKWEAERQTGAASRNRGPRAPATIPERLNPETGEVLA